MIDPTLLSARQSERACRTRQPDVEYKLRVIPDSNGLLELVEVPPKKQHWFLEWARAMSMAGWTL